MDEQPATGLATAGESDGDSDADDPGGGVLDQGVLDPCERGVPVTYQV